MSRSLWTFAAALLLVGPGAAGQSAEFELGGEGEWREVEGPPPSAEASRLNDARRALAEDQPALARRLASAWLRDNELTDSPLVPDAYLIRADALRDLGREFRALYDYEALVKDYPQSELFPVAIERELEIGTQYVNGLRRRVFGFRVADASDLGVEILLRVQERMPGSQTAERAAVELADFYYRTRQLDLAAEAYDLYLLNHPSGPNRIHAMKRRIYSDVARFGGPAHDASPLIDAQFRIREFADEYPVEAERTGLNEALLVRIDESLAVQMLSTAEWHLKQGDWPSARFVLRRLVREQPGAAAADRALDILTERGWLEPAPPDPKAPNGPSPGDDVADPEAPPPPDAGTEEPADPARPTEAGGSADG